MFHFKNISISRLLLAFIKALPTNFISIERSTQLLSQQGSSIVYLKVA